MRGKKAASAAALAGVLVVGTTGAVFAMQGNGNGNGNGSDFAPLPPGYTVQPFAGELDAPLQLDCELPPGVISTARQAAQGGTIDDAQIDFDDIVPVYELGATDLDGNDIEVDVFSDGSLEEIEVVLSRKAARDIPSEVTDLLNRAFPGFEISLTEKSIRPAGNGLLRNFYEFDGTTADGVNQDVEINERGTAYTVEPASLQVPAFDLNLRCPKGGTNGR